MQAAFQPQFFIRPSDKFRRSHECTLLHKLKITNLTSVRFTNTHNFNDAALFFADSIHIRTQHVHRPQYGTSASFSFQSKAQLHQVIYGRVRLTKNL